MSDLEQKTNQILFDYWNELRAGRRAPRRFEIEPARIGTILPETFILERIDHQTFRFRLAGTRICEQFGREFRGSNFFELWSDSDRITLERQFAVMSDEAAACVLTFGVTMSDGTTAAFEAVLLPLVHSTTVISRYLGAMSIMTDPAWPAPDRVIAQRLMSHELIWPDGRKPAPTLREKLHDVSTFSRDISAARLVRQNRRQFRVYEGGLSKSDTKPR